MTHSYRDYPNTEQERGTLARTRLPPIDSTLGGPAKEPQVFQIWMHGFLYRTEQKKKKRRHEVGRMADLDWNLKGEIETIEKKTVKLERK